MYKKVSLVASAVVWILLPKCSACLMAYMSLFSALGLGGMINHSYTLFVIKLLLALNLAASLYLAAKAKQYMYTFISFVCAMMFIINKFYIESMFINILTAAVLFIAASRIRLMQINKKQCLFKQESKAAC